MLTFQLIDDERIRKKLSVHVVCQNARVPVSTYWRIALGKVTPRQDTLYRLREGVSQANAADAKRKVTPKQLILATYRGFLAAISTEMGLDPEKVAASDPSLSRVSDPFWMAAARARAMAIYCTNIELNVPGTKVAEAAGMTKQAVSECLKRVEDLRDNPATDALVERVSRLLTGRAA
jgi:transcriptional regulator with XRE-family HTH domain